MKSTVRVLFVLLALVSTLAVTPASATTYQMVSDQTLADQARAIVEGLVVAAEPAPVLGRPATDYQVQVERVIKGDLAGSTIIVRVPGGVGIGGIGLKIWGAPQYREGDRALLFLSPGKDGVYRPLHLMLGAFHLETVGDRTVAVRELAETVEVTPQGLRPGSDFIRDFEAFSEWLQDRSLGVPREQDYLLGTAAGPSKALGQATEKFTLLRWPQDNLPIRWFRFDLGQGLDWRVHNGGQPGLSLDQTIDAFRVALQTWNDDPATNIRYNYVGTTDANGGLAQSDDVNAILFDDPYRDDPDNEVDGTFACNRGGVLAIGGPYFTIATRTYRGERYHEAVEADIVTNDGTECFFRNNVSVAQEVFAHELGHTLGLGHSAENDALMRSTAHNDNRGARLHGDDRAAIAHLYGGGATATRPPAAPKQLVAKTLSSTQIRLTWRDKSNNEDGFHVEVKQGRKFVELGVVDANAREVVVTELTPNKRYVFRIRAGNSAGFSAYSNQARATTPRAGRNRQR